MSGTQFETPAAYFAAQPEHTRQRLLELKQCILNAAPHATELLNYNIPAYALVRGGKRDQQIMIAGYQTHVGLYPHPTTMEHFASELGHYKTGKGSVQFPLSQPLPTQLITAMVRYRCQQLSK